MYYKIKDTVMFRKYSNYGYLTDNSMFGYRLLNDKRSFPGEKYISISGAVMLECLSKSPKHIDDVVNELIKIFTDVEYDELRQDTMAFFDELCTDGFLCYGMDIEQCLLNDRVDTQRDNFGQEKTTIITENCSLDISEENGFLRSLHIEVADNCNERCVHCYIPHEEKKRFIEPALFYRIIEEGKQLNIINVTLSGGEPLSHKEFLGFLRKCRELDLSVNVLSNLTLLTDEIIVEMKRNPLLSVQTSLYSMNPLIHDAVTKVKGSFEKTKNAIQKILSEGIPIQISCPVMKENSESFSDVVRWGEENSVPVVVDYVIFASYDHSNSNLAHRLSIEQLEEIFDRQFSEEYAKELFEKAQEKYLLTCDDSICSVGRYYLCISSDGKVYPCVGWQNKVVGDLMETTIKEIWESSKELQLLRSLKRNCIPECVECDDRGYCTVCMMSNSNENQDGNAFRINEFHCEVASLTHKKVIDYLGK